MNLTQIATRIYNTPLMLDQDYAAVFLTAIADRIGMTEIVGSDAEKISADSRMFSGNNSRRNGRSYQVEQGVAIIPVAGTLVNKSGYIGPSSGVQGYDGVQAQFIEAVDDASVSKILFDIDSSGGEVAGCFDLCDFIYQFRGEKETVAFIGEKATSAAYALASSCGSIYTPRTGISGSIGVLIAHQEVSGKMKKEGRKVTLIHSGAHKVEGNPYEVLPAKVRENMQARIDSTRVMFASTVARNRGMSVESVMATEAEVYQGSEAVEVGLADGVMSYNEVLNKMINESNDEVVPVSAGATASADATAEIADVEAPEATATVETVVESADPEASMDAGELATLCSNAGVPHLIAGLIASKATASTVNDSIQSYDALRDVLTAAEFTAEQTASVLSNGSNPAEVARAILDAQSADEDISAHIPASAQKVTRNLYAVYDNK